MKSSLIIHWCIGLCMFVLVGCSEDIKVTGHLDFDPEVYPDYKGVTIPPNIAPMNFEVLSYKDSDWALILMASRKTYNLYANDGIFSFEDNFWKTLLADNRGEILAFQLCLKEDNGWKACKTFEMRIAEENIDPYLVYRLIPPGYSLWKEMGIYQRNLGNFEETAIYKNREGKGNCVNCHSFRERCPDEMLLHMRSELAGTYVVRNGNMEKLDTKTEQTLSALVYPYWHPSGRYVAFSVNKTFQVLHARNVNRIEVCDEASDVVVYDVDKHEIVTSAILNSENAYETFPAFSPDGKSLYFCSAVAVDSMPKQFRDVKYSLCRISFDEKKRSFGTEVDTLYNAIMQGRSASFPRVSPDGQKLVYTLSDYGNFSIWHKDADLYSVNLQTGQTVCLDALNSDDVESYHSWSSNSRWMVFSSRREDGLYTKPYIVYVPAEGTPHKPFLLPQQNPKAYYKAQMNAYNIPELVSGKVEMDSRSLSNFANEGQSISVSFVP